MRGQLPIPDWALPYFAVLLVIGALVLLVMSVRSVRVPKSPPRKRWGNAVGYCGGAICTSTIAYGAAFQPDFMPWPFATFVGGMLLAGVGGGLASWTHRPRF